MGVVSWWRANVRGMVAGAVVLGLLVPRIVGVQPVDAASARGAGQPPGLTRVANGVYAARVVPLVEISIPQGTLAIPRGWILRPIPEVEGAYVAPPGHSGPAIYFIPAFAVSDLRYGIIASQCTRQFIRNPLFSPDVLTCLAPGIRQQIVDSSHPWPPVATVQLLLQVLARGGLGVVARRVTPRSPSDADYEVVEVLNGQKVLDWGHVTMAYLPNLLLSSRYATPGITSLAFLDGCRVQLGDAPTFRPVCTAVQGSVRMNPQWLRALVAERMRVYEQEFNSLMAMGQQIIAGFSLRSQMIRRFGQSVQQMQYQMFQRMQEARVREAQDWMAALRGEVTVQDPRTGEIFPLPYAELPFQSPRYCRTQLPDWVLIGDRSTLGRGVSVAGYTCETVLRTRF